MGVFGAVCRCAGNNSRQVVLTGEPNRRRRHGPLTNKGRTRSFAFESLRSLKDDMLVARVTGIDREAAEALKGVEIFARRDRLPSPNEDEFYYEDLGRG